MDIKKEFGYFAKFVLKQLGLYSLPVLKKN